MRARPPRATTIESEPAALLALLDAERTALLAGQLGQLPELARKKEASLARYTADPERLRRHAPRLLAALQRNQRLLDMSLKGLAAAQGRLTAWQHLIHQMDIYDPVGRRTRLGSGQAGKLQKKI